MNIGLKMKIKPISPRKFLFGKRINFKVYKFRERMRIFQRIFGKRPLLPKQIHHINDHAIQSSIQKHSLDLYPYTQTNPELAIPNIFLGKSEHAPSTQTEFPYDTGQIEFISNEISECNTQEPTGPTSVAINPVNTKLIYLRYFQKHILIIGTCHGFSSSGSEMLGLLDSYKPDTIALEICSARLHGLSAFIKMQG
jgi:hypothetical protein